jgi:peptidoglycan/xylan/chitin deacetylase (PgdA/CDA1 family)
MDGFFEKVIEVHRKCVIPATFFCCGKSLDMRTAEFRRFFDEVKDDPLFDIQDHSYSHIGIAYEKSAPLEATRTDYERSFAAHERVFGRRPVGVSLCGTSGRDGERVPGFDVTDKARSEFEMLASLGVRMVNTLLSGSDPARDFISYAPLGHPDIMGFPSGPESDVSWFYRRAHGDPEAHIARLIRDRAAEGAHMAVILHDWCAWEFGPDKDLGHVVRIAETARRCGYEMATHVQCLRDATVWAGGDANGSRAEDESRRQQ